MKNLLIFLTIFSILTTKANADSVNLTKGQPAPFNGVLLDNPTANQLFKVKLLNESLETTLKAYQNNADLDAQRITLLSEQNDKLARNLQSERSMTNVERILWVSFGIVAAGVGAWAISKVK